MPPVKKEITRQHERQAWRLRQRGLTIAAIAEQLSLAESTVFYMLQRVEDDLAEKFVQDAARIKARQTAILEHAVQEAFQQWGRSCEDAYRETVVEGRTAVGEGGHIVYLPDQITRMTEGQSGNPGLLAQAMKALADIREIWGLDAPKKNEHSGPGGGPIEFAHAATTFDYRLSALVTAHGEGGAGLESLPGDEGRPALPVGAMGETESASTSGRLEDVADPGGQRVWEDEDGSGARSSGDREWEMPEDGGGSADGR